MFFGSKISFADRWFLYFMLSDSISDRTLVLLFLCRKKIQPCGIFFVKFPQGCMCCYGFTSSIFPLAFFLKSSS